MVGMDFKMRAAYVILAIVFAAPSSLAAQCQLCVSPPAPPAHSTSIPLPRALTIEIEAALDFSRVAQLGLQGGSVSIDPRTGARSVSGGLRDLGGGALNGKVHVHGEPLRPIRVVLPTRVTLTAADGSSIDVVNLVTDLPRNAALGIDGLLSFSFGGRLNVAHASAGDYHGRIPISVEYQ